MIKFTLSDSIKNNIAGMKELCSIRLVSFDTSETITAKITKIKTKLDPFESLVKVDFEYLGRIVASTKQIRLKELEDALHRIRNENDAHYFDDDSDENLGQKVSKAIKFRSILASLGDLENERGIIDSDRYTVCLNYWLYELKPTVTHEQLMQRYRDWNWDNFHGNMRTNEYLATLVGNKNVYNIIELSYSNDIRLHTSMYEKMIDGVDKVYYWDNNLIVNPRSYQEDGLYNLVYFNMDKDVVETAYGNDGIKYLINQISKIICNPESRVRYKLNKDDISVSVEKLNNFVRQLGDLL